MLGTKIPEKIGFRVKIGESVKALFKLAQPAKVPVDQFPLPDRGPVERCKKHSLSSNSLSFSVEGRSRVTITCQALSAPTTSEPIAP